MTQQEFPMKLHIKTAISGVLIPLLVMTFLTACSSTGLFSSIETEVKLNDPTMQGTITSLEVANNTIYVTNGTLYQRIGGTGNWHKMSMPSGAEHCSEVASDGTYLYARFTKSNLAVFDSVQRYDPASGWTSVTGVDNIALISSGNTRIYAFTGSENTYNAYVTTGTGSTTITPTAIATGINTPTGSASDYFATNTKVYSYTGVELGTSPSEVTGITTNGTNVYAVNSGVWRYNTTAPATGWTRIAHSITTPTTNISYLGAGGKNLLLIGSGSSSGGFGEVLLAADGSFSSTDSESPGDTGASSITTDAASQYNNSVGQWAVHRIFAVSSPHPSGDSYVLYACVVDPTDGGLWSYYSGTRHEWNRE